MTINVREALEAGRYCNNVPYTITRVPVDEDKMTVKQAREHTESEKQRGRDQMRKHREREAELNMLVKSDLEAQHGIVGHPKADKLWSLAWDAGHSAGYSDVITYYEDFVELLK